MPIGTRPAAFLFLAMLLAGCSSGAVRVGGSFRSSGPFGSGGPAGTLCTPVPPGSVLTDAMDALENHSRAAAQVTDVTLADPNHGLKLLAAYVVPATASLYGVRTGYPHADQMPPGEAWALREYAAGAKVPAHSLANLMLVLEPAISGGYAAGIDVYYKADQQKYILRTATRLQVMVGRPCAG